MPTCTICHWCPTCHAPNEHVLVQYPSCTMTDEGHVPTIPCTCKRKRNIETGEWWWEKPKPPAPPCPKHGSG